jgi:UDP-2,4-diacetamido-2,4,6-trideoxy-beta-L-altropyranose hydrolase
MHIYFRVEGNQQVGLGHLMRCFALAQAATNNQIEVSFICTQTTADFMKSRHHWMGNVCVIPSQGSSEVQDIIESINASQEKSGAGNSQSAAKNPTALALVLDGYQYNAEFQQSLKNALATQVQQDMPLVYFDDTNSTQVFPEHVADMIINGADSAHNLGYESNASKSKLCLGNHFLSLRSEFMNLPVVPLEQRHSILICFGGADTANHTLGLLAAFCHENSNIPLCIVTGVAYQEHEALKEMLANQYLSIASNEKNEGINVPMPVQYIHDAQDMAELMLFSRLAISAAGGTQFELLHSYTPSLLVVVADNQIPATEKAETQGWASAVDASSSYSALAKAAIKRFNDIQTLQAQQNAAENLIQGLYRDTNFGTENILDSITSLISNRRQVAS